MPRLANQLAQTRPVVHAYAAPHAAHVRVDHTTRRRAQSQVGGIRLTESEIRRACDGLPPILSLDDAAKLSHYSRSTLKRLLSEGRFKNSVKRKKPVLFWRDRFIQELMQG